MVDDDDIILAQVPDTREKLAQEKKFKLLKKQYGAHHAVGDTLDYGKMGAWGPGSDVTASMLTASGGVAGMESM